MRWRQVLLLYGLAAGLGLEWWRLQRAPTTEARGRPGTRERLLPVALDAIHEVRLVQGQRAVTLQRWDGQWSVADPVDAPIPTGLVEAFVAALAQTEQIERVADGDGNLDGFGLGDAAPRVEVRQNGVPICQVVLGSTNPTGTAIYARRTDRPGVYLIGRNVAYYEGLLFQALPPPEVPAGTPAPVGG